MADRPIIFSAPMVRALLDGRKTQTRRVLKPQPPRDEVTGRAFNGTFFGPEWFTSTAIDRHGDEVPGPEVFGIYGDDWGMRIPYARGDRRWVREAWNQFNFSEDGDAAWPVNTIVTPDECREISEDAYRFSPPQIVCRESDRAREWFADQKWRSPIHMPRWASRITLTVTDVRVQRVQDISEDDARAEGAKPDRGGGGYSGMYGRLGLDPHAYSRGFKSLWNSIHGPGAWDANPWVAAITFTVRKGNIDHD